MVKVVCAILSSSEALLQWAAPHLTLTPDFSNIRLSRPGGCIDHSGSLAERQRRSPHGYVYEHYSLGSPGKIA